MSKLSMKNNTMAVDGVLTLFLLAGAGLVLPIFLLPVVKIIGYSEIVEELAKALIVLFVILRLPTNRLWILAGVLFGFLFGMSESVFYLNNIFQLGNFSVFWQRFLWTVPMHIITVLVILFAGLVKKWFLIFGLTGTIALHILFNGIVIEFLIR